jgi:hypothetical protein
MGSGVFVVLRGGGVPRLVGQKSDGFGFMNAETMYTFRAPGTTVHMIDIASGAAKDSVTFNGRMSAVDWSPTTSAWLAEREGEPVRIVLASATGTITDTLGMTDTFVRGSARWAVGRRAMMFLVGITSRNVLAERPVSAGAARFAGTDRIIQRDMPELFNSFSTSSDGQLALGEVYTIDKLLSFDLAEAGGHPRQIAIAPGSYFNTPYLSPDGRQIAVGMADYQSFNSFVFPSDGGASRALTHAQAPASDRPVGWTTDGTRVILNSVRTPQAVLSLVDVKTGRIRPLDGAGSAIPANGTIGAVVFEIAGGQLVFLSKGSLFRADTVTGKATEIVKIDGELRRASPDGKRIAISGSEPVEAPLSIVDVETGKVTKIAMLPRPFGVVVGWGRDGNLYLPKKTDTGFELWRMADTGGALTKFATLTERCWPYGFDFAVEAKRAVCYSTEVYPDIWMLQPPGSRGKK